uniref:Uncharacterized protein n=1 Tax=Nelumbo nucifera TaxID=4432 RepID=A0A822ZIG9_NELNU|nr:TPA_asm: hypothetical protein HUJ06_001505 [Nelumbo nucifera]
MGIKRKSMYGNEINKINRHETRKEWRFSVFPTNISYRLVTASMMPYRLTILVQRRWPWPVSKDDAGIQLLHVSLIGGGKILVVGEEIEKRETIEGEKVQALLYRPSYELKTKSYTLG